MGPQRLAPAGRVSAQPGLSPNDTGWSAPHGDFSLPGSPEEGWSLQVGDAVVSNNRSGGANLAGSFVAPTCAPEIRCNTTTVASAHWASAQPFQGVRVSKTHELLHGGTLVRVEVTLENTTGAALDDVYYLRNIDPDNNHSSTGSFSTTNTIVSQADRGNDTAHVMATAGTGATLSAVSLIAHDSRARVSHGGFSNRDPQAVWSGVGVAHSGSVTDDKAISLALHVYPATAQQYYAVQPG